MPSSPLRSANTVIALATAVKKAAAEHKANVAGYRNQLTERMSKLGLQPGGSDRALTAAATAHLVQVLADAADNAVIKALVEAQVSTSASAMGDCLTKASQLLGTLSGTNWEIFDAIANLGADHETSANAILNSMREAILSDEHVIALGPALMTAQSRSLRLITSAAAPPDLSGGGEGSAGERTLPPRITPPPAKKQVIERDTHADLDVDSARSLINRLTGKLKNDQSIRLSVSWIIEE